MIEPPLRLKKHVMASSCVTYGIYLSAINQRIYWYVVDTH